MDSGQIFPDLFLTTKYYGLNRANGQPCCIAYFPMRETAGIRHDHDCAFILVQNREELIQIRNLILPWSVAPRFSLRDIRCLFENF